MFRLVVVIGIPVLIGLVGGPALLLARSYGELLATGLSRDVVASIAMAAFFGGALGLLPVLPNVLGALVVNKIGLRSWTTNTVLFAIIAGGCFGFLSDWLDTMLRVVGGIDLLGERTMLWLLFVLNLILCCVVHRGSFLPKKVRTVS